MDRQRGAMAKFVQNGTFEVKTFNQLLVMWMIRHALPWNRIEDLLLGVAFDYVRRGVKIYARSWIAMEAHKLYCNLQCKVLANINVRFIVFLPKYLLFLLNKKLLSNR
jgi:hypothetical protein